MNSARLLVWPRFFQCVFGAGRGWERSVQHYPLNETSSAGLIPVTVAIHCSNIATGALASRMARSDVLATPSGQTTFVGPMVGPRSFLEAVPSGAGHLPRAASDSIICLTWAQVPEGSPSHTITLPRPALVILERQWGPPAGPS